MTERSNSGARHAGGARRALSAISLAAVLAASLAVSVLTGSLPPVPVESVRGPMGWEMMTIDGNRNGDRVAFSHAKHAGFAGKGGGGCISCHHLALPGEDESSCARCHRDMSATVSIFDHDAHIGREKGRGSCAGCHRGDSSRSNMVSCGKCHESYSGRMEEYRAVRGYREAMHGLCSRCHGEKFTGTRGKGSCGYCHR